MKVAKRFLGALLLGGCATAFVRAQTTNAAPDTAPSTAAPTTSPADQASEQFMRFVESGPDSGELQTAIVSYRNEQGVAVDLVGAVHVGEKSYYDQLNSAFAGYDALLYEMVKSKGAAVPHPGQRSRSAVGNLQRWLKDVLQLDYQLDDIDYTKGNFVHADLDYETFQKMQSDRGESMVSIMIQSMMQQMARDAAGKSRQDISLFDLLAALRSADRPRQFKLMLARQFSDLEDQMSGLTGPNGSVIVTERNKQALSVLTRQIDAGQKHLGIFYGAAHMKDMQTRLEAMGFKPTGEVKWLTAWSMPPAPATNPSTAPTTHPAEKARMDDVEDPAPGK